MEIRIAIVSGVGVVAAELTGKGNLWAAGNTIYCDLGDGYDPCILLYTPYTSKNTVSVRTSKTNKQIIRAE